MIDVALDELHGRQPLSMLVVAVLLLSFAIAAYPLFLFTGISLYVSSGPAMAFLSWRQGKAPFGDLGTKADEADDAQAGAGEG